MTAGNNSNRKYEELYTELLGRGEMLHESNKRRIRRGIFILIILPFVLEFIRWLTDSDKVVFLIIWILIMFVLSAYLISVEYLDYTVEETLRDVTDTEADFDELLALPHGDLHERIHARIEARRAERLGIEPEDEEDEEDESGEPAEQAARIERPDKDAGKTADAGMVIEEAMEQLEEVREAEAAMEELQETVPAEIITAMKEAFDADMHKKAAAAEDAEDLNTEAAAEDAAGGEEDEA